MNTFINENEIKKEAIEKFNSLLDTLINISEKNFNNIGNTNILNNPEFI